MPAIDCLGCQWTGVRVLAAAIALLVVPTRFLLLEAFISSSQVLENVDGVNLADLEVATPKNTFTDYFDNQAVDLLPSIILLGIGLCIYIYEWILRKLMERRTLKLRAFLGASLERLRELDARRDQLEGMLQLARGAAVEYNLLLYLLLRKRKDVPSAF